MQATCLTLMCHARTVAQKLARFAADEPVEMDWQSAAGSLYSRFQDEPRLFCAPELRTRQTTRLLGGDAHIVTALRDLDLGRWQGVRIKDLQKTEPEALQAWLEDPHATPHGGESLAQLDARVAAWLATMEARPGAVVAVTHPFVMRAALGRVLQSPACKLIDVEPLSVIELRFHGRWRLRLPGIDLEGVNG